MLSQVYPRSGSSTQSSTSSSTFSSSSSSPSSSNSPTPGPFNKGSSSSFFTFLVALLILVLASGALVVRAVYLRRRFRNQVQAAIEAGILNLDKPFTQQTKPELYEIHVRSLPSDAALGWSKLLPISAINLDESISSSEKESNVPTPSLSPRLTVQQRINHALRRLPISNDISNEYPEKQQHTDESTMIPSRLQVAVLIAMPSEYPSIHPLDETGSEGDLKGKQRDSSFHDDSIPDVIFGISSLPLKSSQPNTL